MPRSGWSRQLVHRKGPAPRLTVEIAATVDDERGGRPMGHVWLVRLRRGTEAVEVATGLGRPSAEVLARRLRDLIGPGSADGGGAMPRYSPRSPRAFRELRAREYRERRHAGPIYWYHARRTGDLRDLQAAHKPLTWRGRARGREWVVGYHPKWASFQGWGAPRYAQLAAEAFQAP